MPKDKDIGEVQGPRVLQTEIRHLTTPLTEEETRLFSHTLAKTIPDLHIEELRQKGIKEELKHQIDSLQEKISSLANTVANNSMVKPIEVETILDGVKVKEVRTDTGEIVITRPATDKELQTKLHLVD